MNESKLNKVLDILEKYDSNKLIDYYELFSLNKNMSIDDINNDIRKNRLQVLFHPDQIHFIPEQYHSKYLEMIEIVKNAIDTFSSYRKKELYDNELKKAKNKQNYNSYSSTQSRKSDSKEYTEDKTEDLDEVTLVEAIILNSKKYDLNFTMHSLIDLIRINSVKGFTRNNGVREMVSNIPREKILNIIYESSVEEENLTIEQVVINYMTDLMSKVPEYKQQVGLIEQACAATFYKYDMNGYHNQTKKALYNYCNGGDATAFTNDNNVRKFLTEYGDKKNAEFFVKCSLNKERKFNKNYAYSTVMANGGNFTDMYMNMLNQKLNNQNNYNSDNNFSR